MTRADPSRDHERIPLDQMPENLVCPECGKGPFKSEAGFRGHCAGKHDMIWELVPKERKIVTRDDREIEWEDIPDPIDKHKLQPWLMIGIAHRVLYGMTFQDIVDKLRNGRGESTLRKAWHSPAGQAYRRHLEDIASDARGVVKMLMDEGSLGMFVDWMAAFEWAKEARDYDAVHKMVKDIGLSTVLNSDKKQGTQKIVINLGSGSLDTEEVETDYEVVDADWLEEDS